MLKTLLTILIIFLILRYVARLFNVVSSAEQPSGAQGQSFTQSRQQPNITVTRGEPTPRHNINADPEYVDYEEVDE